MTTKVVNKYKEGFDEYIGRGSLFGNPFKVGIDGNRKECIEKYEIYFHQKMKEDPFFSRKVRELKGKTLGCFCKPQPCHGDIIASFLEES